VNQLDTQRTTVGSGGTLRDRVIRHTLTTERPEGGAFEATHRYGTWILLAAFHHGKLEIHTAHEA
jgi:hypothetical protein